MLGVGEIGLNKNTPNEAKVFQQHVQMAIDTFQRGRSQGGKACDDGEASFDFDSHAAPGGQVEGTRMILEMLKDFGAAIDPGRVLIDHVEEHTIKLVKDAGYWAGMTIYPVSKCTPQRAVDMIEMHGAEQLCVNAAADWG